MRTGTSAPRPYLAVVAAKYGRDFAELIIRQRGMVQYSQCLAVGVSWGAIRWNLDRGTWQVVHPDVYYVYSGPPQWKALLWAGLLHAGPGAVLDGSTAAELHGLRGHRDRRIHLRVANERHPEKRPGLVIRRTRHFEPRCWVWAGEFPAIRRERAVITMAERNDGVIPDAVQQGVTTPERIRGVLLSLGPIKGRQRMLAALDDVEGGSRSQLERLFLRQIRRARLPMPERNYKLLVEGRRVFLDACYPKDGWFIEIDGRAYHIMCEDWEDDLDRQNMLVLEGWLPLRFTARSIRENLVAPRVAKALGL